MSSEQPRFAAPPIELDPHATAELVGVPQEWDLADPQLLGTILHATAAVCDDEIPGHVYEDPRLQSFFGVHDGRPSGAMQNIRRLIDEDHPQTYSLVLAAARYLAEELRDENHQVAINFDLDDEWLEAPGGEIRLSQKPGEVIEYGPGIRGVRMATDSIMRRFPYVAISEGPFVSEVLWRFVLRGLQKASDHTQQQLTSNFRTFDTGMAAASTQLLQERAGEEPRTALVIASFVHKAARSELETGIANAFHLLQNEGALFIQAPESAEQFGEQIVTASQMFELALEAGFAARDATYLAPATAGNDIFEIIFHGAVFKK